MSSSPGFPALIGAVLEFEGAATSFSASALEELISPSSGFPAMIGAVLEFEVEMTAGSPCEEYDVTEDGEVGAL